MQLGLTSLCNSVLVIGFLLLKLLESLLALVALEQVVAQPCRP